jgi:hypothetical protein
LRFWLLGDGSRALAVATSFDDPLLATGNWQLATGNWQLATGNWQLATGNWQLISHVQAGSLL